MSSEWKCYLLHSAPTSMNDPSPSLLMPLVGSLRVALWFSFSLTVVSTSAPTGYSGLCLKTIQTFKSIIFDHIMWFELFFFFSTHTCKKNYAFVFFMRKDNKFKVWTLWKYVFMNNWTLSCVKRFSHAVITVLAIPLSGCISPPLLMVILNLQDFSKNMMRYFDSSDNLV